MRWILNKIIGTKYQRDIKRIKPLVAAINAQDEAYRSLSESALRAKTDEFRERIAGGAKLDDIMVEAFAAAKNACQRLVGTKFNVCEHEVVWDMVPFDVQLIGAIALHHGKIAEMATGEGKTLVATMPLYLNSLAGGNVHLITVNDYLARRDSHWMGLLYEFLGVSVGCIQNQMSPEERRVEYSKNITYGTNSEFGFDYLRDNGMAHVPGQIVQNGHFYAIVDEVDSILIDEARTPLIISGPAATSSHQYVELAPMVARLVRKQTELCNSLIAEAKAFIEKGEDEEAKLRLYQVRHGMPKNKQLLHMIEDSAARKMMESIESALMTDMHKEQARALREELFFNIDERGRDATLTDKGCTAMSPTDPDAYVMPDLIAQLADLDAEQDLSPQEKLERRQQIQSSFSEKSERIHNVDQLIRAYCLYEKDVEYVVQENRVLIVDEFTGRILPGRRWSDGLHQAIEAKEGVQIERETQTLATITIQNYFRMYDKLAGMTGTAETEANEFRDIYKLDVLAIPTNRPVRRVDSNDVIYRTRREKYGAIIDEVKERHERGQPVLLGTISVDTSELLSRMLKREGIPHSVLNAKNHEREADIVMRAGQAGAVTIATNMAGRGTDIKMGEGVVQIAREIITSDRGLDQSVGGKTLRKLLMEEPCGLHVIGSERHESRRIDRQLRGRCARQGDPGSSQFYVSLEDDLMRLFGSDRISNIMARMGMEEGQELAHPWLNRSIETAQRRVEQHNYSIRRRTLEYDDVMNKQRTVMYDFRGSIVKAVNVRETIYDIVADVIESRAHEILGKGGAEAGNEFIEWVNITFPIGLRPDDLDGDTPDAEKAASVVFEKVKQAYEMKIEVEDAHALPALERYILLHAIDSLWQEYLWNIDQLREGVGLRAYGHQDPLVEYKKEAYTMFATLMDSIKLEVVQRIFRSTTSLAAYERLVTSMPRKLVHREVSALGDTARRGGPAAAGRASAAETRHRNEPKVGRNDPCPCGSGKKFKKCCGA